MSLHLIELIRSFSNQNLYVKRLIPLYFEGNHIGFVGDKVAKVILNKSARSTSNSVYFKYISSSNSTSGISDHLGSLPTNEEERIAEPCSEGRIEMIVTVDFPLQESKAERARTVTKILEDNVLLPWKRDATFACLKGWRDERYSVFNTPHSVVFDVERAAVSLFGLRTYGCHMNGFVRMKDNSLKMWIAKRSMHKQTDPGMLDNMAAGGLSSGYNALETMIKECGEEAGIPPELAKQVRHVGAISYYEVRDNGIESEPGTDFCFDLELPADFVPCPQDGEVESFQLLSLDEVLDLILQKTFKSESMLVAVDFMIRHGFLDSSYPSYLDIVTALRVPFTLPSRSFL